jgi:uracil-DNA glycosylase
MSHARIGWAQFTDTVIQTLAASRENLVFLLWGKFAQEKVRLIDESRHHILKAAHPSPLSAHNGFFGCRHFSKTNQYLLSRGIEGVEWNT